MDTIGVPLSSVTILIRKVENGYVVSCLYPPDMIPRPHDPVAEEMVKQIKAAQAKGDMNPMDLIGSMMSSITSNPKEHKPLRKPHEEYVFQSMDSMMKFVGETFSMVKE